MNKQNTYTILVIFGAIILVIILNSIKSQPSNIFVSDSSTNVTINNTKQPTKKPIITDDWMDNLLSDLSRLKFFNAPMPEQYPGCKTVTLVFPDGNHVRTCVEINQ